MKHFKNQFHKLIKLRTEEKIHLLFITLFYTLQILFITLVIPQKKDFLPHINSTFGLTIVYIICGLLGSLLPFRKCSISVPLSLYCPISIVVILSSNPNEIIILGGLSALLSGSILYHLKFKIYQLINTKKLVSHLLMKAYKASFIIAVLIIFAFLIFQTEEKQLYIIVSIALFSAVMLFNNRISDLINHYKKEKDERNNLLNRNRN